MSILRTTLVGLTALGSVVGLTAALAAQQAGGSKVAHTMAMPAGSTVTPAQKIANAMTAAPESISARATVLDWPSAEGQAPSVLRPGTNGWTCLPDMPESMGNDPMCLDEPWMKAIDAYLAHKSPQVTRAGVGYMMAPDGAWGSNSDPYAMGKTPDNHWRLHGPHLMILVPDLKALEGIPTDPDNGGPYVMWAGTPYAHIMAPTKPPTTGK